MGSHNAEIWEVTLSLTKLLSKI